MSYEHYFTAGGIVITSLKQSTMVSGLQLIACNLSGNQVQSLLAHTSDSAAAIGAVLSNLQVVEGNQTVAQDIARGVVVVGAAGTTSKIDKAEERHTKQKAL